MEKHQHQPHRPKNSNHNNGGRQVLKFLRAASSINFNNPPFSPSRDSAHPKPPSDPKSHNLRSGFSGPLPRVPRAVRGKFKSGEAPPEEPTSPTISCIGQIKHKSKKKTASSSIPKPAAKEKADHKKATKEKSDKTKIKNEPKKQSAGSRSPGIWKIFGSGSFKSAPSSAPSRRKRSSSTSDAVGAGVVLFDSAVEQPVADRAPGLSQMRRFASGHRPDGFGNFDWTAQIAPVESDCRDCSDDEEEERGGYSDEDTDGEEVIVPFSARIRAVANVEGTSLKPRKEVNLWKRRTMDPPRPLQLVGPSTVRPS